MTKPKFKKRDIDLKFVPYTVSIHIVKDVLEHRNGYLRSKFPNLGTYHHAAGYVSALHTSRHNQYFGKSWIIVPKDCSPFTASHEVVHCVDSICDLFGFDCTEFRAYMHEYILEQICNELI